ncbi:hypothetical protein AB4Z54_56600, partial [Streptomyces sp. MCAF7]
PGSASPPATPTAGASRRRCADAADRPKASQQAEQPELVTRSVEEIEEHRAAEHYCRVIAIESVRHPVTGGHRNFLKELE